MRFCVESFTQGLVRGSPDWDCTVSHDVRCLRGAAESLEGHVTQHVLGKLWENVLEMRDYVPTSAHVHFLLENLPTNVPRTLGVETPLAEMSVEDVAWYRDALASIIGALHDRGTDQGRRLFAKGPRALPCNCAGVAAGREKTQQEPTSGSDGPKWRCLVPCSVV